MIDWTETSTVTTRRGRRIMAGEGMVTPLRPLTVEEDGMVETLVPGRSRLTIEHPLVARQPERFDVCWKRDRETRARLREYLRRAQRTLEAELRDRRSGTKADDNYGLGPSRTTEASWRL